MNFCTLFSDGKYAIEGWVMAHTLFTQAASSSLFILCMDESVYVEAQRLSQQHNIIPIHYKLLEQRWPRLFNSKHGRQKKEYIVSFKPFLPHYIFETYNVENVVFVDADIAFLRDPSPMFKLFDECSFFAKDHEIEPVRSAGRFNVGLLGFKNDDKCLTWLKWWQEKCIEWCFWYADNGRFAEQGYWNILHNDPDKFPGFISVKHPGFNLAPWNIMKHTISSQNGNLLVDGQELITYHYHEFELRGDSYFPTGWKLPANASLLYKPYFELFKKSMSGNLWR